MKKRGFREILYPSLVYFLPIALFFSYRPVLSIGASETMNFEFSIAEIYLLVVALISCFDFKNLKEFFSYYGKKLVPFVAFPIYVGVSAIWSPNHLRAVFTAGLLAVLVFDALEINLIMKKYLDLKKTFCRYLLCAALIISVFCWAQCLLDVLGVARSSTGLCEGCVYGAFGFPHPNGFAIEPQFMGNLLLVPTLMVIYDLVFEKDNLCKKKSRQIIAAVFLTATLFLTLSRGAIYAFMVGLVVIWLARFPVIKYNKEKSNKVAWWIVPIVLSGFLMSLVAQGTLAQISPTSDTFWGGVTKVVHQLSLGKIDVRPEELKVEPEESKTEGTEKSGQTEKIEGAEKAEPEDDSSKFTGYVEQSTSFRTQLTKDALDVWDDNWGNFWFGTGAGSAGIKMLEKDPELGTPKEIVQNQYAEILLEFGLVGAMLVVAMFVATVVFGMSDFLKNPLLIGITAAFLVSLVFFSGLPNALQVYLFPLFVANPVVQRSGGHKKQ